MYEEKKKRFPPPLTHLYLTETPPFLPISTSLSQTVSISHPNPRHISTLPPLSFVTVFISKKHLTLCTYPPCGIRVGWALGVRGSGVGNRERAVLLTQSPPPLPPTLFPFYFTYRRLVSLCFYSRALRWQIRDEGGLGKMKGGGGFVFCLKIFYLMAHDTIHKKQYDLMD